MNYTILSFLFPLGLLLGMFILIEIGRRMGARRLAKDAEGGRTGFGAIEGSVFGLMGLLVAFSFSGAASRFDSRRQLIVEETNAIGTAYLRLDLLPSEAKLELQELFRQYVDSRLSVYQKLPDISAALAELERSGKLQRTIWSKAVAACQASGSQPATMLLLPALNQMIDITTTRTMAARLHPPTIVFIMLGVTSLVSSLLAGYGMAVGKTRSWVHMLAFAATLAVTVYVICDMELPRFGLIRVDSFDRALVELRQGMN
jgi:hypothetical protein